MPIFAQVKVIIGTLPCVSITSLNQDAPPEVADVTDSKRRTGALSARSPCRGALDYFHWLAASA